MFVEGLGVCSTVGSIWVNNQASRVAKLRVAAETIYKVLPEQTKPHTHTLYHTHTHTQTHTHTLSLTHTHTHTQTQTQTHTHTHTQSNGGLVKTEGVKYKNNEQNSKTNKQEVPLPQINKIKLDSESWASEWEFWNVLISGQTAHFKEGRGENERMQARPGKRRKN